MSMPGVFTPPPTRTPPTKLSQEEAFALMLAHLHLTENTFNKRDLRNSCSSVKVRLGLLCLPVVLAVAMPQHCAYPTPNWGSWVQASNWATKELTRDSGISKHRQVDIALSVFMSIDLPACMLLCLYEHPDLRDYAS